jgi:hypothetical protein
MPTQHEWSRTATAVFLLGCVAVVTSTAVVLERDDELAATPVETPKDPTQATGARFLFAAPENASIAFECLLDNTSFGPCTTPHVLPSSTLSDGVHFFTIRIAGDSSVSGHDTSDFDAGRSPAVTGVNTITHHWTVGTS